MSETAASTVAGTVAILGRPNVGKSTLLNRIVGEKLAIVTPKPQTTRNRIIGVWNGAQGQIAFVDTPGVHAGRSELNRFMVREALATIDEVDAILLMAEASPVGRAPFPEPEGRILVRVREARKPVVLAINKVDLLKDKAQLLPQIDAWNQGAPFAAIVPVSATQGVGIDDLVGELLKLLPPRPPLYDADMLTDRSERFLVSELVREQLFLRLRQELPYSTAVVIDDWQERPQGDVVIDALILVERDSQKGIVVGKGGQMIREVGTAARGEVTRLLGRPSHLRLRVKVAAEWTSSPEALGRLGYKEEG